MQFLNSLSLMGSSGGSSAVSTSDFKAITYTGTGASNTITGLGFQPDLVIIKDTAGGGGVVFDSVRGATKWLPDTGGMDAEGTVAASLTSFDSDGFTLGANGTVNGNTINYVAWCWALNVNQLDIVSYVGNATNRTISHGLTPTPQLIITKNISNTSHWAVKPGSNQSSDDTEYHHLNATTTGTDTTYWNNSSATSSVFPLGTSSVTNANTNNYISYLFAESSGVSKIDKYTGTGTASGNTVVCGFVPSLVIIRGPSKSWHIHDTARGIGNSLSFNTSSADDAGGYIALTADGFEITTASAEYNTSATVYHYMAFK